MSQSTLQGEEKLWKKGFKWVIGLDEAGRGSLAGPVVAAAVIIKNPKSQILNSKQITNPKIQCFKQLGIWEIEKLEFVSDFGFRISNLKLRDSKKLSPQKRERFYKLITKNSAIEWGIGKVSEKVIDKINILEATKLAMKRATKNLLRKLQSTKRTIVRLMDLYLILDGNFRVDLDILQKSVIKADEKVFSCAAASIIAKVKRDRIMVKYHKKYPQYGFDKNKGYPTKYHKKMLKKYGPCKIHRKTFKPIKLIKK